MYNNYHCGTITTFGIFIALLYGGEYLSYSSSHDFFIDLDKH